MPVDIKQLFTGLQGRLVADLESARAGIAHPGDKGSVSEADWRRMLTTHLPERYSVAKATVIDSQGNSSDSIDIVIFDRVYTYLLMERDGIVFVPAEAVYAVLEVKQDISKEHIVYAGAKAASVRRLMRTSGATVDIRGATPTKLPIPILAGLLALGSSWNPPFGDSAISALAELDASQFLDICCAARDGSLEVTRLPDGSIQKSASPAGSSLLFLLLALVRRLQAVGTVAPIDLNAYSRWL